jgi:uncharacterized protein
METSWPARWLIPALDSALEPGRTNTVARSVCRRPCGRCHPSAKALGRLRPSEVQRHGTVLLPGRREGLSRHVVFQIATRFRGCDVGNRACQFSQAYVIAVLVGHHVQNLLGILPKAQQAQRVADSRAAANHIQMQVTLQADCLAGIWANRENEMLKSEGKPAFIEPGDVEAALRTAVAIGDDRSRRKAQGYIVPDSFTHGSTEQRQRWFNTGFRSGSVASCNTFAATQL